MQRVRQLFDPQETWLWVGGRGGLGYGQMKVEGRRITAQRISYAIFVGEIPAGMTVNHKILERDSRGVPIQPCILDVNPDHLELLPNAMNVAEGNSRRSTAMKNIFRCPRCGGAFVLVTRWFVCVHCDHRLPDNRETRGSLVLEDPDVDIAH